MKPLVIYHANCPDGFTAAWVAARALGDVDLFKGRYGDDPPYELAARREVYVVDFSYPRAALERLEEIARGRPTQLPAEHPMEFRAWEGSLMVFDHHKTAESELHGLEYCIFDMERSGAGMTWDHFHPGKPRPWIVDYVEDRDLWRFKLPNSKELSQFIRSAPHDLDAWDGMAQMQRATAVDMAKGCKRYLDHYVRDALKQSYVIDLNWIHPDEPDDFNAQRMTTTAVVNVPYTGVSDVLNAALEIYPEAQMALAWHLASDGKINCSLRSVKGFDCSEFARARGGGGHAQAAGFRLPFDLSHGVVRQILGNAIPQGGFLPVLSRALNYHERLVEELRDATARCESAPIVGHQRCPNCGLRSCLSARELLAEIEQEEST